jgi:hypothetical protein
MRQTVRPQVLWWLCSGLWSLNVATQPCVSATDCNSDAFESSVCFNTKFENTSSKKYSMAWVRERTYTPRGRRLSAKLVPTFAGRGRRVVSVTDPYDHILGFLDRSRYFFFQVAPQLYSRGWVDPVPDPLLRKSGSSGNRDKELKMLFICWYWLSDCSWMPWRKPRAALPSFSWPQLPFRQSPSQNSRG